ncbi:MAG: hypothetical protein V4537_06150 [Pseudomonadota bacterium]
MVWFKTIDHQGQEIEIASIDDMNAVVDAFELRLDHLALLLEGADRNARVRAAAEYRAMVTRRDRIEADARKAEERATRDSDDDYHRALAKAIRTRTRE